MWGVYIYMILVKDGGIGNQAHIFTESCCWSHRGYYKSWGGEITLKDFSALLDMRKASIRVRKYSTESIYMKTCSVSFFPEQSASLLISTLSSLQGVLLPSGSAAAVAHDSVHIEADGNCQPPVHRHMVLLASKQQPGPSGPWEEGGLHHPGRAKWEASLNQLWVPQGLCWVY